jgi:tRNA pseudouridine65 synthase
MDETLQILYHDDQLVAVHKPAGLLVHRSDLDRHETRFALQLVRDQLGMRVYPVHRLDRPTSGLLLFALSPETARVLAGAFEARLVEKRYLAVVRGIIGEEGVVDHPLADEPDRSSPGLPSEELRTAVTAYRRMATTELPFASGRHSTSRYSLVELRPLTGRRRQLRRHMKHLCHPMIGDTTYGEGRHNRLFRDELKCGRLLLHAAELSFSHPATGLAVTVTAPLEGEFAALLHRLGWRDAVPPPWLLA